MKKLGAGAVILSVALLLVLLPISGCARSNTNATEELDPIEIREYEGKKLSSVDDFRENSIKGPQ